MNSLEFVNNLLKFYYDMLRRHKHYNLQTLTEETEKTINTLLQIKAELESLKIIKEKLVLDVEAETATDENGVSIRGCWLVQGDYQKRYIIINPEEYDILKKALEVNE